MKKTQMKKVEKFTDNLYMTEAAKNLIEEKIEKDAFKSYYKDFLPKKREELMFRLYERISTTEFEYAIDYSNDIYAKLAKEDLETLTAYGLVIKKNYNGLRIISVKDERVLISKGFESVREFQIVIDRANLKR